MSGPLSRLQNLLWHGRPTHETRARCPCHLAGIALLAAQLGALPAVGAESAMARSPWRMPAAPPLRVFSFRGYWYPVLRMDRAWARLGGVEEISRWSGPQAPMQFPTRRDAISRYHMIVVMDMDIPSWPEGALELCRDYVRHGGSMLFFGGLYAFREGYAGSVLEDISPVRFRAGDSLRHAPDGIALRPGPDATALLENMTSWEAGPTVYWYHEVDPKPDSLIVAQAGDAPVLVAGRYGDGRVAVFAGTVMGESPSGQTPFWLWSEWPRAMASTTRWLVSAAKERVADQPVSFATVLRQQLIDMHDGTGAARMPEALLRHATAADLLTDLRSGRHDLAPAVADAIVDAVHGLADAAAITAATGLIDPERPPILAGIGLRILGMQPPRGLATALESAFRQATLTPLDSILAAMPGRVASTDIDHGASLDLDDLLRAIEDAHHHRERPMLPGMHGQVLDDPDVVMARAAGRHIIRVSALAALGYAGQPASLPCLRAVIAEHRRDRSREAHTGWGRMAADELHDEALLAAALCGDAEAVRELTDLLLLLDYAVIGMFGRGWSDRDPVRRAELHAAARLIRAWSWRAAGRLPELPAAMLPVLADRLASDEDVRIVPLAQRMFSRAFRDVPPPAPVADALRAARIPAVAELVQDAASGGRP